MPYRIHTVLTDNGTHFTDPTGNGWTPEDIKKVRAKKLPFLCHAVEGACADLDVEHHRRIRGLREASMSIARTAELAGCSIAQVKWVTALHRARTADREANQTVTSLHGSE